MATSLKLTSPQDSIQQLERTRLGSSVVKVLDELAPSLRGVAAAGVARIQVSSWRAPACSAITQVLGGRRPDAELRRQTAGAPSRRRRGPGDDHRPVGQAVGGPARHRR